jgi:hypothetical protein
MKLSDLPYPLRLCAEVLHYSTFSSKSLQELQCGEIKRRVEAIFGIELVEEAFQVLMGNHNPRENP